MPQPTATPNPAEPLPARWINRSIQDLATRLKVGADEIQLVVFEPVTWPDGGLGCPEPGMLYPQVHVDGFRIRLLHNGQTYDYHGSMDREPFLCQAK